MTALESSFNNALVSGQTDFFASVYIPVKIPTSQGMPNDYTYTNIGLSATEIAKIYADYFGLCFLVEPLQTVTGEAWDYSLSVGKLARRIKSVLLMNNGKYMKLMELEGFVYNPLWNVDGTEIFSSLENSGEDDETTTTKEDRVTFYNTDQETKTQTNTYDGTLRDAEKQTITQDPALSGGEPTKNYTRSKADPLSNVVTREYIHKNADNNGAEYTVSADDTAFGEAVTGGNKFHTDKRIRSGNIGVTASQDLIQKSREILRFSIIDEFFRDINTQILIGIYDV